jgi:hypothetical protein
LPLCPIPGPKGDSDVAGLAGHGDGPFGQGRQVQHSDVLDRLGGTQARRRRLNAKMGLAQLTQNVDRFARDKPELHAGAVQLALLRYLIAACGQPRVK